MQKDLVLKNKRTRQTPSPDTLTLTLSLALFQSRRLSPDQGREASQVKLPSNRSLSAEVKLLLARECSVLADDFSRIRLKRSCEKCPRLRSRDQTSTTQVSHRYSIKHRVGSRCLLSYMQRCSLQHSASTRRENTVITICVLAHDRYMIGTGIMFYPGTPGPGRRGLPLVCDQLGTTFSPVRRVLL